MAKSITSDMEQQRFDITARSTAHMAAQARVRQLATKSTQEELNMRILTQLKQR